MTRVYEEIIDFIAGGTSPRTVAAFKASPETAERVAELLYQEKRSGLGPDERSELNHYLEIEHLMRLAKARAHQHLPHE